MRVRSIGLFAAAIVLFAASAFAQEASIFGAVTDQTKGALPGATITATSLATGRLFTDVSDERGDYRLRGLAPGRYKVQAELSGFATIVVPDVEVLVGQNRPVPFAMQVATLSETLTVTGESPLVDITSTQVSGNVDRRQMEELPLQGRNWMELAMQVKGITANAVDNNPGVRDRAFQLNLDGQEITQQVAGGGFGQPRFSREAIAEFQVVTNLFDVTQGRSLGIQVQAISRSGTNNLDGSVYGYFRDDNLNEQDFIANRVLPYSNQQIGGAVGGPIIRDKLHYFLSYERENEPNTIIAASAALGPTATWSFPTKLVQNSFLGRGDWQLRQGDHITSRVVVLGLGQPVHPGVGHRTSVAGRRSIAQGVQRLEHLGQRVERLDDPGSARSTTATSTGRTGWRCRSWPTLRTTCSPSLTVGQRRNYPQEFYQNTWSVRYDLTTSKGAHDLKFGAEYLRWHDTGSWQLLSRGEFIFTSTPADILRRFPVDAWNDPTRWDVTGLDSIANALRRELRRLDHRHPASDHRPLGRRHLEDQQLLHGQRRRALGRRFRRARSAAHHHHGHLRPARPATSATRRCRLANSSIPATCATSTTSPRAAGSPGTSAARATWSYAAAAASTSASPTPTPPSASSRSTASGSWSTRSRTTAGPASSRIRRAASPPT